MPLRLGPPSGIEGPRPPLGLAIQVPRPSPMLQHPLDDRQARAHRRARVAARVQRRPACVRASTGSSIPIRELIKDMVVVRRGDEVTAPMVPMRPPGSRQGPSRQDPNPQNVLTIPSCAYGHMKILTYRRRWPYWAPSGQSCPRSRSPSPQSRSPGRLRNIGAATPFPSGRLFKDTWNLVSKCRTHTEGQILCPLS